MITSRIGARGLFALALVALTLVAGLLVSRGALAGPAASRPTEAKAAAPSPSSKIDARILADTANGGHTSVVIYLADQANVNAAYGMKDQDARGWYVYNTLKAHADRTQGGLKAMLDAQGIAYQSFWVANEIIADNLDGGLVNLLAARPDVARLDSNHAQRWIEDPVLLNAQDAPDSPLAPEWGVQNVNAPAVWAMGFTGQGIVVGNQDTGMRWTHNAIKSHYRGWDGTVADHNYNWHDSVHTGGGICGPDSPFPCDDNAHGTHTTGTTVGDDGSGNQIGVAPGAKWIGCRNMDQGVGTPASYSECFQFFIAPTDLNGNNPNPALRPHVMNNSWGCPVSEGCTTRAELETIVNNTQASGIFVEVSAGNSGPNCSSVTDPPAIYDAAFATGAINSSNVLAGFSSRGPSTFYTPNLLKPNISAPGVNVRSSTNASDTSYSSFQGTSMAGPHVVGVVALLWSARPQLVRDIAQTKTILENTANPNVTVSPAQTCGGTPSSAIPNNSFGYGRVDVLAAVNSVPAQGTPTATVTGTPPTATNTPVGPTATNTPIGPTSTPCAGNSAWTAGPPLSTTNIRSAGVVYPGNNRFYVLGGRVDDTVGSDNQSIFEYNPTTNAWATKAATLPDNRTNNGVGAVMTISSTQYVVYVGGSSCCGATAVSSGDVRLYNPTADTLVTLGTDPWPAGAISSTLPGGGAVYNNKLYILGGFDITGGGAGVVDTIWEMDPARPAGSRWVLKNTHLPTALGYIPVATLGNYLYTGGGASFDGSTLADSQLAFRYDPVADAITAIADIPTATSNTKAIAFNGQVWVLGGGFTAPNPNNLVQAYDPGTNTWTNPNSFINARRNEAADTDGTHIYMAGGYVEGAPGLDMEIYGPAPCATPTVAPSATNTVTPPPQATSTATSTAVPTACPIQFEDVPVGSTFYDYIRCLACRGIVGGYPCGGPGEPCPGQYYRPNNNVTRGQVSKIVSESAGFSDAVPSTQQTFEDVPPSGTFWLWIERLSGRGIIGGYACGGPFEPCVTPNNRPYFRPNNDVTRGQLSKIVAGAAGWTETPTTQTFEDVPVGSTFYVYVERIASRGIVNGYPCGGPFEPCVSPGNLPYFRPNNQATRGQMAKIAAAAFFPGCSTPARTTTLR
jgi:subtilisin family serine protease